MASSTSTMGTVTAQQFTLKDTVLFQGATDNSKTISLKLAGDPTQAGDVVYSLPVITANKTLATTDDVAGLPSATDGQMLVSSGADNYSSVNMSGDCTINASGAVSIGANKLTTAMFQAGAVDANALATNAVQSAKIANDAVSTDKLAANAVTSAKLADGPTTAGTAEASKFVQLDATKDIKSLNDVSTVSGGAFYLGDPATDGTWRIQISGTSLAFGRRETGSYVEKGSFSA